jgi:hypothetical protein
MTAHHHDANLRQAVGYPTQRAASQLPLEITSIGLGRITTSLSRSLV